MILNIFFFTFGLKKTNLLGYILTNVRLGLKFASQWIRIKLNVFDNFSKDFGKILHFVTTGHHNATGHIELHVREISISGSILVSIGPA